MVPAVGGNCRAAESPRFVPVFVARGAERPRGRSRRSAGRGRAPVSPGQPPLFPRDRRRVPARTDGTQTGAWSSRGAAAKGTARGALISGTKPERARGGRDGSPGALGTDPRCHPAALPRSRPRPCPRERGTGTDGARPGPGLPEQPPVPPRGDAEICAPAPHLGSAGRGRAPLPSPNRLGPAPAASRPPWAPSEVRRQLRRSGGAARRGAQGAARGWAGRGARGAGRGRLRGRSWAAVPRRAL